MHRALFIDEILQEILECSSKDGLDNLSHVARCCRAWKDPALDRLWSRLSSVDPLFALIPEILYANGAYGPKTLQQPLSPQNLEAFRTYAARVKHISHRRSIYIDPRLLAQLAPTSLFPRLTSAQISPLSCPLLQLSSCLRQLDLDLGFKPRPASSLLTSDEAVCTYVEKAPSTLDHLSIRGLLSLPLSHTIASMNTLRVLSLRTGKSLTPETLAALPFFPHLASLEIHAAHLDADAIPIPSSPSVSFPSLRKLHVRADIPLTERFLQLLQPDTLHALRIDIEAPPMHPTQAPVPWGDLLNLIGAKAAGSLRTLTIEHHPYILDLDDAQPQSLAAVYSSPTPKQRNCLTFDTLRPLSSLRTLERLIIDTSAPPDLDDADMARLARWWGKTLVHLDLGTCPGASCEAPRTTLACLPIVARECLALEALVIPADIRAVPEPTCSVGAGALRRLTLACAQDVNVDTKKMARFLRSVFPLLEEVDGGVGEDEEGKGVWGEMREAMKTTCVV